MSAPRGKSVRWTVREGDGATLAAIVARAGGDARAIAEGRVFVGRSRARDGEAPVHVGDEVSIADAGSIASAVTILHREVDFVAVDKPAGIPTIADHAGSSQALVARAAEALGLPETRLHPTSRLDREVSGVVIFALTPAAADRLKRAREAHTYARRYVAIASRAPSANAGTWDAPIGRAKDPRHRAVNGREAIAAKTHFAIAASASASASASARASASALASASASASASALAPALLALAPITGRTHQLRVHASHAGAPLLGDRVYGAPSRITLATGRIVPFDRIALHAARVTVPRVRGAAVAIDAPIPADLAALWLSLGGDEAAWDTAVSWPLPNE